MSSIEWLNVNGNIVAMDTASGSTTGIQLARRRWFDAVGPDVFKALIEFNDEPVASAEFSGRWTVTKIQAGSSNSTFGPVAGQGGLGIITTDNADGDGINAQFGLGSFSPTSTSKIYFGCRYKISEATQSKLFLGLSVVETSILGTPTANSIGFRKVDAATGLSAILRKSSAESELTTVMTQDADLYHTVEFFYDGPTHRVYYYVDDEETTRQSTFVNVPDNTLLIPSVVFQTGEAVSHTMTLDFLRTIQIGRN